MDTTSINYTPCLKKLSLLRKYEGKEEWAAKKHPALPVPELWQAVSKQEEKAEVGKKDIF